MINVGNLAYNGSTCAFEGVVAPGVSAAHCFSNLHRGLRSLGVEVVDYAVERGRYSVTTRNASPDAIATILGAE